MDFPVFTPTETVEITGRGTVHIGPCPIDDVERNKLVGSVVTMDGRAYRVKAFEWRATVQGPRKGDTVGLMLEPVA